MTMTSGAYRNAYPAAAAIQSPAGRLGTGGLHRGRRAEVAARDPCRDARERQRGDGEHDREHAAERPVARLQELLLDDVAYQAVFRAAQDVGDGENAERGNEYERRAGVHARERKRKGDAPETLPGIGAEVLRRIEQRLIVLLQIRIKG